MDSDSSFYTTTYSEDERIQAALNQNKEAARQANILLDQQRETEFAQYYETNINAKDSIFDLPGLSFTKFTHKRIKFSFQPCRVARLVSKRAMFYVSLRFRKRLWQIKRDSIPADKKSSVYSLFRSYRIADLARVMFVVEKIYLILVNWAKAHHKFRQHKYRRLQRGEDLYLDADDEELFLSDSEIEELHIKRKAVWKRMLPPTPKQ